MKSETATLLSAILGGIFVLSAAVITIDPHILFDPPPSVIDITPYPDSPQARGALITWITNASDDDQIYYKFQLRGPSTDHRWKDETNWSKERKWIWNTKNLDVGNYTLQILVTDRKFRIWGADGQMTADFVLTYSAEDWYNMGINFYNDARYENAYNAFNNAIEMRPDYVAAWSRKGATLTKLGKYSDAILAYQKIALDDRVDRQIKAEAENEIGIVHMKQGDCKAASKHFAKAVTYNLSFGEAWKNSGDAFICRNKVGDALNAYAKAKELGYMG